MYLLSILLTYLLTCLFVYVNIVIQVSNTIFFCFANNTFIITQHPYIQFTCVINFTRLSRVRLWSLQPLHFASLRAKCLLLPVHWWCLPLRAMPRLWTVLHYALRTRHTLEPGDINLRLGDRRNYLALDTRSSTFNDVDRIEENKCKWPYFLFYKHYYRYTILIIDFKTLTNVPVFNSHYHECWAFISGTQYNK